MKRKTSQIKKYELFATLGDIAFIIFLLITIIHSFIILVEPESRTEVINVAHNFFNVITIYSTTLNSIITAVLVYLVIYVPITSINVKNLISKEIIELDKWSYRTQSAYGILPLVPLIGFLALTVKNPGFFGYFIIILIISGCALYFRFKSTYSMKKIVVGYGFVQTVINFKNKFISLFKKEFWANYKEIRKNKKISKFVESNEQQDLDKTIVKDLVFKIIRIVVTYTFLTIFALFIFIPFYWMIITSLKSHTELTTRMVPRFFISVKEMHWENYKIVFGPTFSFGKYILNTLVVGVVTMLFTVVTTILAAFAFSRLKFPGRDFIFLVLLGTMMIPGELYTITNYVTVSSFGWINTFYALIIPFSTSVFYIFFLRQSFLQIPETLYQSAKVDGCSDIKYLTRVMLPIAQPTLITIVILSTIGAWDAYIWPRLVTNKDHWLISVALRSSSFTTGEGSDARPMYNLQLAATAIVTIPLMIIFFAFKKYIIKGVGRSGTKG